MGCFRFDSLDDQCNRYKQMKINILLFFTFLKATKIPRFFFWKFSLSLLTILKILKKEGFVACFQTFIIKEKVYFKVFLNSCKLFSIGDFKKPGPGSFLKERSWKVSAFSRSLIYSSNVSSIYEIKTFKVGGISLCYYK